MNAMSRLFVFLNPNTLMVVHNINRMGRDRLTSMGCDAICNEGVSAVPYDDGSAQYAAMIPDASSPGSWVQNPNAFTFFVSPYQSTILCPQGGPHPYNQEYEGETIRLSEFPLHPSRFSSLFAFGSMETCQLVAKRFGWKMETVRSCRLAQWDRIRIHRVSMDLVTMLRNPNDATGGDVRTALWRQYWRGESVQVAEVPNNQPVAEYVKRCQSEGEIWEYLIEGQLVLDPVVSDQV